MDITKHNEKEEDGKNGRGKSVRNLTFVFNLGRMKDAKVRLNQRKT